MAVTTLGDKVSQDEWRFTVAWAAPTPRGFVVAGLHEEAAVGGGLVRSRMLSLVTVDAGHITEVGDYCTGPV